MSNTHSYPLPSGNPQSGTKNGAELQTLRIAICGAPGSGKSKIVALLQQSHLPCTAGTEPQPGDVTRHPFRLPHLHFVVMDSSAELSGTQHLTDACSAADVLILVLNCATDLDLNARRQLQLAAVLRVKHLILAINCDDETAPGTGAFGEALDEFVTPLGFTSFVWISLSSTSGTNISCWAPGSSECCPGLTLIDYLEGLESSPSSVGRPAFAVHARVSATGQHLLLGEYLRGSMKPGDRLRLGRKGSTSQLEDILPSADHIPNPRQGISVALLTSPALDAQEGDILSLADQPLESSDHFETTLIWTGKESCLAGHHYELRLANQRTKASITMIRSRLNVTQHIYEAARNLESGDIGIARISTETPVVFDNYRESKTLGRFTLTDIQIGLPVATGLIHQSLRRAQNVHRQALSITRNDRELINGHKGKVVWFTGLSGSGKSTLANALDIALHADGKHTYILDGDNVRQGLNKDLGFTDADRVENIRRIAEVAKLMMDAGLIVLTAFISPFRQEREMARTLIGAENFIEVFISTPLAICEARDPKGLYKKARSGQLPNMTGIGSPYEPPENAKITLDASSLDISDAVRQLKNALEEDI